MFSALTNFVVEDHKIGVRLAEEEEQELAAKQAAEQASDAVEANPDNPRLAYYHTDSESEEGQVSPSNSTLKASKPTSPTGSVATNAPQFTDPEFNASRRRRWKAYQVPPYDRVSYPYDIAPLLARHHVDSFSAPQDGVSDENGLHMALRGWKHTSEAAAKVEKALGLKKAVLPALATALSLASAIVDDVAAEGDDMEGAEQLAARLGYTVDVDEAAEGATAGDTAHADGHTPSASGGAGGGAGAGAGVVVGDALSRLSPGRVLSPTRSPSPDASLTPAPVPVSAVATGAEPVKPVAVVPNAATSDPGSAKEQESSAGSAKEQETSAGGVGDEAKAAATAPKLLLPKKSAYMSPEERAWRKKRARKKAGKSESSPARSWRWRRKEQEEEVYDMLKLSAGGGMTPSSEMVQQRRFWRPGAQGSGAQTKVVEGNASPVAPKPPGMGAPTKDWNEEFQRLVDSIPFAQYEIDQRTEKINEFTKLFAAHCCVVVEKLLRARAQAVQGSAIKIVGARQLGSGRFRDFYLHHRVLYWLLSDDSMLGSQEFAYKALSKEVSNGMQLLAAGVPGVHPLLTTAVDFLGRRVLCIAVAPLSDDTTSLVAGSTDTTRNVFRSPLVGSTDNVTRACQELAQALHLSKHEVLPGKETWFPADSATHVSRTDGRMYFSNVWRLFPPVTPLREVTLLCRILHDDRHTNAQIRKEDGYTPRTADSRDSDDAPLDWDALGSHPGAGSSLAFMRFAPPLMVAGKPFITNPDLVHSLLVGAKDLLHADPRSMEVRAVYGGRLMLVCMRKKREEEEAKEVLPMNTRASVLAKRRVLGPALVVSTRCTFVGRPWLYQFMRPEFLRLKATGSFRNLSPDVCTMWNQGTNADLHASAMDTATWHIEHTAVKELVADLEANLKELERDNPGQYSQRLKLMFHKHGVNLRYLGHARRLTRSKRLRELLLSEMMARTVRLRVNRALRHVSSGNASIPYLKGRVAKAFNAMMCGSSGDGVVAGSFRFPASPIDVGLRKKLSFSGPSLLGRGVKPSLSSRLGSPLTSPGLPSFRVLEPTMSAASMVLYDHVDGSGDHDSATMSTSLPWGAAAESWRSRFVKDHEFAFKEALWQLFPHGLSTVELKGNATQPLWSLLSRRGKERTFHRACELTGTVISTPMFAFATTPPLTAKDVLHMKPRAKIPKLGRVRGRITNALTDEQRLQLVVESLKKEVASRVEVLGEGAEHTVRVKLALGQALAERQETLRAAEKVLDDAWTYAERLSGRARLADSPLPGEPLTATTNPLSPAAKKQHLTQDVGQLALDTALSLGRVHRAKAKVVSKSAAKEAKRQANHLFTVGDEIACDVFGERSIQRSDVANEHGQMLTEFMVYKEAEQRLFLASSIREEVLGDRHPDVATTTFNLATVYDKLKLYNKATPLYLQARNVRHLKLGNNSPEYSATLVRLVHVYKQLEKETAMDWEGLDKADKDFST